MHVNAPNHVGSAGVKRWALFAGVDLYHHAHVPSLRYCVNDAQAMYDCLVKNPHSGYSPERTCLLLSEPEKGADATRRNILKQLQRMANQTQPEDMLLFYFAGHGQSVGQEVHLFPADVEPDDMIADTAVSLARVKQIMASAAARAGAIILDACYTGVSQRSHSPRTHGLQDSALIENLLSESEGLAILHSTARSDAAFEWDEMKHGVFTYYVLEGLRGGVNAHRDTLLTVDEIHRYVTAKVAQWAKQHQVATRPTMEFMGRGDLVLASTELTSRTLQVGFLPEAGAVADVQYASAEVLLASLRGGQRGFVGRDKELQRVLRLIQEAPTPNLASLVIGGPGIGKTSFFNQIKFQLPDSDKEPRHFHAFSIEPGALSSWYDFAAELRGGIARCVEPAGADYTREPGKLELGELAAQLEAIQRQRPETTFVVFLDEFDKIFHRCADLEQQRIRDSINALVENERVHIIFVLSVLQELPPMYASRLSADVFSLHPLAYAEIDKLLAELLRPHLSLTEEETAWIYDYTGGHPYFTRLLAVKLLDVASQAGVHGGLHGDIFEQASKAAVQSGRADNLLHGVYAWYLNDDQRFVLLKLAFNGQRVLSPAEFARMEPKHKAAIKQLVNRDYLAELPDGSFRLRMGFLFDWLFAWEEFEREAERLQVENEPVQPAAPVKIHAEGISIDLASRRVYVEGEEIRKSLSDLPYRALVYLAQRLDAVVSKDALANELWPDDLNGVDDQRIATVISRLRQALGDHDEKYLQTLHKQGYRLRHATLLKPGASKR